jgi:pyruvate formate lyase activating enzyme
MGLRKASYYWCENGETVCGLCAHQCRIKPGRFGRCGVRQNVDEVLYTLVYGELVAEHIDPVEKKPLFHVLPGSLSLSIATMGCNFKCQHCQNHSISQVHGQRPADLKGRKVSAEQVVESAIRNDCKSISYTYVEPTIFFEFAYDCALLAAENNLKNIFVSNGYLSEQASRDISPYLDVINIDIKSYNDDFYKKICGARLKPVLDNVKLMKELGVWVEVTTLVIPGHNDSNEELSSLASFLVSVDPSIPWHVSAFYPTYNMTDRFPTPSKTLTRAAQIGRDAGLKFVYEGNSHGGGGENTFCPSCGEAVISRYGFSVRENRVVEGCCPLCKEPLPGIWS